MHAYLTCIRKYNRPSSKSPYQRKHRSQTPRLNAEDSPTSLPGRNYTSLEKTTSLLHLTAGTVGQLIDYFLSLLIDR